MDKKQEPNKVIEFDKATAQLHVRVETQNNLVSTADKNVKTGNSKTVLEQSIYKAGIKELIDSLEEQKAKHLEAKQRTEDMLAAEVVALEMIDTDLIKVREAIGDLKFEDESKPTEPEAKPKPAE